MKIRYLMAILFVQFAILATACTAAKATPTLIFAPTIIAPTAPAPPTVGPTVTSTPVKGELNVLCTNTQEWCDGMKKEFQAKYPGITLNYTRLSVVESLTRLRNEKTSPQFDIWWGGPIDSFLAAKQDGLLDAYKSAAQANIIDTKLMLDSDSQWIGIYVNSLGFATNTKQTTVQAPKSLDDLIKSELKGQIAIAHPSFSATSYTFVCSILQIKGEKDGWDYLKKFSQNISFWSRTDDALVESLGKGETAVGVLFSQDIIVGIESGLPLTLTFPAEGTGYDLGGMGIVKGAKNLGLAKVWYDWALQASTEELGKKYHVYQGLTIKGATPPRPELTQVKLANYNFDYCGKNKTAFVDKFSNEIAASSLAR